MLQSSEAWRMAHQAAGATSAEAAAARKNTAAFYVPDAVANGSAGTAWV
jgi:hypothetical protein